MYLRHSYPVDVKDVDSEIECENGNDGIWDLRHPSIFTKSYVLGDQTVGRQSMHVSNIT